VLAESADKNQRFQGKGGRPGTATQKTHPANISSTVNVKDVIDAAQAHDHEVFCVLLRNAVNLGGDLGACRAGREPASGVTADLASVSAIVFDFVSVPVSPVTGLSGI
jgi:hypothetical protein